MKLITIKDPDSHDGDWLVHLSQSSGDTPVPLCGDSCPQGYEDINAPYACMNCVDCARRSASIAPHNQRVVCADHCDALLYPFFFADYMLALVHWRAPHAFYGSRLGAGDAQ